METRYFDGASNLVRLHVLADSDLDTAQRLKMLVVRSVRRAAARICENAGSAPIAFARLDRAKGRLLRAARRRARLEGFWGKVRVETGRFSFPDKVYNGLVVPAGRYPAVRVVLGQGKGHNWWCVVYPDLCAVEDACAQALASGGVSFYSTIVETVKWVLRGCA